MITRLKQVVLIGTFLCASLFSNAQQIKKFADDETMYFEQLEQFFSNSAQSQDLNKYLKQFKKTWDTGGIDRDEKSRIIETSNNLLKKYGKPSPHFDNFLRTVEQFFLTEQSIESFHAWDQAYNYLLKTTSLKKADDFCEQTLKLLTKHELFSNTTLSWTLLRVKTFSFVFENNEAKLVMPATNLQCTSTGNSFVIYQANGYFLPFDNIWVLYIIEIYV